MRSKLRFETTPVFTKNLQAFKDTKTRFIVNRGGSRSSKTYSILQLLIWYALTSEKKTISICRKTGPALYATAYRDFVDICADLDILTLIKHNKSRGTFDFPGGTVVQFFSIDEAQKLRGRKHDVVYINEANEIKGDEFLQLNLRTREKIILDFNPSDEVEWIIDLVNSENGVEIHSTYRDNTFLSGQIIREIENLVNNDATAYQIYALGIYPIGQERVFSHVYQSPFLETDSWIYGMDFGYNDPSVIVKVKVDDGKIYIHEELFETHLDPDQLIAKMNQIGISKRHHIYADSSRPDLISQIKRAGFSISNSDKKILPGIDYMKTMQIHVTPDSKSTYNEFKKYSYKIINEKITEHPVDFNNHAIDAARYAVWSTKTQRNTTFYVR